MLYQTWSINFTGHLICSSQSTCRDPEEEKHLFVPQTHACALQIAKDSICATEMSRAILNPISDWDGTACLLNEDLWLPRNSCQIHPCLFEFLREGRRFQRKRIIYKHHDQQLNPCASDWKCAGRGYQLHLHELYLTNVTFFFFYKLQSKFYPLLLLNTLCVVYKLRLLPQLSQMSGPNLICVGAPASLQLGLGGCASVPP